MPQDHQECEVKKQKVAGYSSVLDLVSKIVVYLSSKVEYKIAKTCLFFLISRMNSYYMRYLEHSKVENEYSCIEQDIRYPNHVMNLGIYFLCDEITDHLHDLRPLAILVCKSSRKQVSMDSDQSRNNVVSTASHGMRKDEVCLGWQSTDSPSNNDPIGNFAQVFGRILEPTRVVDDTLDTVDSHKQSKDSSFHRIQVPEIFIVVDKDNSDYDGDTKKTRQKSIDGIDENGLIH